MNLNWIKQTVLFIEQNMKVDWNDKERIITPILFSITVLLLFNFAVGEFPKPLREQLFFAEVFLILLFSLQVNFSRLLEPEQKDQVFTLLQTYPISSSAWFLGKFILSLFSGIILLVPLVFLALVFLSLFDSFVWQHALIILLSLIGLSALGCLLSAITVKARGKEVLFPLIYFPLSVPVLLCGLQGCLAFMSELTYSEGANWASLLVGFNIIYLTLSLLLYSEVVDA